MVLAEARERTAQEFANLFALAGLAVSKITLTPKHVVHRGGVPV